MPAEALTFEVDDSEIRKALVLVPKQIPFAISLALTKCAQAAQADTLKAEQDVFTVRTDYLTRPSSPGYFRVVPARKTSMEATVGTRGPLLEKEVFGGVKAAGTKGSQGVPTEEGHGGSTTAPLRGSDDKGTLLKKDKKWPRHLMESTGAFFTIRLHDSGRYAVFQHTGKTHPAKRKWKDRPVGRDVYGRDPIQMVYMFEPTVTIKPVLPFKKIVELALTRNWDKESRKALNEALMTAKV